MLNSGLTPMTEYKMVQIVSFSIEVWSCILLGVIILIASYKQNKNLIQLLGFLLASCISALSGLINLVQYNGSNLTLNLIEHLMYVVGFAFLYSHIENLLILTDSYIRKYILIFLVLYTFIAAPLFYYQNPEYIELYSIITELILCVLFVIIIVRIRRHNREIRNQYSDSTYRELKWILYSMQLILVGIVIMPLISWGLQLSDPIEHIAYSVYDEALYFALTYSSFYYKISENLLAAETPYLDYDSSQESENNGISVTESELQEVSRANKSILHKSEPPTSTEEEDTGEVYNHIRAVIDNKKLFLQSGLTIVDLARELQEHPRYVSKVINKNAQKNFKTFINEFRVAYAKKLLRSPDYHHITIDEIGIMSGFQSKSSFYSNFNKQLNITPLQFQKQVSEK